MRARTKIKLLKRGEHNGEIYIFLIFFAISVDHRASPCSSLASFLDVSRGRDSRSDGSDVLALDAGGAVCGDPQRMTKPRVIVSASCASCPGATSTPRPFKLSHRCARSPGIGTRARASLMSRARIGLHAATQLLSIAHAPEVLTPPRLGPAHRLTSSSTARRRRPCRR